MVSLKNFLRKRRSKGLLFLNVLNNHAGSGITFALDSFTSFRSLYVLAIGNYIICLVRRIFCQRFESKVSP